MKSIITFLALCLSLQVSAQGIFDAGIHTATPFGDVNSPASESSQQVIDQDETTKFLDFNILDGIGFEVDLGMAGAATASSMAFVTANDAPERDPTDYEIFGSNDGVDYTSIATGTIPCISDRFLSRIFPFANATAYSIYRINFTGTCGTSTINQIADVQLFTTIGNAPTITCPDNIEVGTDDGICGASVNFFATSMDVEDGMLTPVQTLGPDAGEQLPIGETAIVFSVQDSDGNAISCDFTITVEDDELPQIQCSENISVNVGSGETEVEVEYDVVYVDNCSVINPINGFTSLGTIDGKSYYLSDSSFNASLAFLDAFNFLGFVATIRSEADNSFILNAANTSGGEGGYLIGYTDISVEGAFEWHSGDGSTYTNWNMGEPNNSGAGGDPENYTIMLGNGMWNDVEDVEAFRYILEVDFELQQVAGLESGDDFPLGTTTNTFIATDAAGNSISCEFTVTVGDETSVEDQILSEGLTIAPNPATDQVVITNESAIALESLLVYDVYGKLIQTFNLNQLNGSRAINVSDLSAGIYLMKFEGEMGSAARKLIKQ